MSAVVPLTVTHVLEHLYCPRFTYFEYVLGIPERQERRPLVQAGKRVHEERKRVNPGYLRRKLGVVERRFDVPLASVRLGVRGCVDEVLTLEDGTMAPFDYKFARAPKKPFANQRMQSLLYGLLIQECLGAEVRRGFLCYVRSNHQVATLEFGPRDLVRAEAAVAEVLEVIRQGRLPEGTAWPARCRDCCYRNVCLR